MKLSSLLIIPLFASVIQLNAQLPSNTIEYIDVNNIKAGHLVHGDMWWNPATSTNACEFPKGSGKHVSFLGSLWMGGYDAGNNLRVAAQTYRQTGSDFFPGPIDTSLHGSAVVVNALKWAKIWKVNRSTIDSFRSTSVHTIANTPKNILTWPAKGNINAKGSNDSVLVINRDLAPFADVNNDGIYNALAGDYPLIKGDQMLWWVINDYFLPHQNSGTGNMDVEIQNFAYAYQRNNSLDNTVFYEFLIKNAGPLSFSDFRFGFNNDVDLGYAFDDYIGFDSSRRMGYVYNSKSPDGNGEPSSYGTDIPIAGVTFLQLPGDNFPSLVPLGTFNSYSNAPGTGISNPTNGLEYYRLMSGLNRIGGPMLDNKGQVTHYAYPGNPSDTAGWSQCQQGLPKTEDRRYLMASDGFTLASGETKKIAMALVITPNAGSCPSVNLTGLITAADSAKTAYWEPPLTTGIVKTSSASRTLRIYPNPAKDILYIKPVKNADGQVLIYDATGRNIPVEKYIAGNIININTNQLTPGIYTIIYKDGESVSNNVFVKE